MQKLLLSSIQRFSLQDGPGIRTTIFLKGCTIRCPWCANPENLTHAVQYMFHSSRCVKNNGTCFFNPECKVLNGKLTRLGIEDSKKCLPQAIVANGQLWNIDDLFDVIKKDKIYYDTNGGVTFSGGEAMQYIEALFPLINKLKNASIDTCIETALFIKTEKVTLAAPILDRFIVDIKLLDQKKCAEILHGDIKLYLKNLEILFDYKKPVIMRLPLIKDITMEKNNLEMVYNLVKKYKPQKLEIFSVHNLAEKKYSSIGKKISYFEPIENETLEKIKLYLSNTGVDVKIIHL